MRDKAKMREKTQNANRESCMSAEAHRRALHGAMTAFTISLLAAIGTLLSAAPFSLTI